jgi:hypothetical protein
VDIWGAHNYGIDMANAVISNGAAMRIPNGYSIFFRNAANSADIPLIGNDSLNNVFIGSGTTQPGKVVYTEQTLSLQGSQNPGMYVNNSGAVGINFSGTFVTGYGIDFNPAGVAPIRYSNNTGPLWRNAANSADLSGPLFNSSNQYVLPGGVTCSGTPTSSFATINGVVTHC